MSMILSDVPQQSPISETDRLRDMGDRAAMMDEYVKRRLYYDGEQYEAENLLLADSAGYVARKLRLPEHLRKHAYSSHIGEAVDTLADMLAASVQFEGAHADILNEMWIDSGMADRIDDWTREGLMQGDTYATVDFDAVTEVAEVDLWEAEAAWPVYAQENFRSLQRWYRFQDLIIGDQLVREVRMQYIGYVEIADGSFHPTLMEAVWNNDEFLYSRPLYLPVWNFVHARGDARHRLRSSFGDSMITTKVRGTADRYNAIEQLSYRIARQNSFSTIAVVGDAANLNGKRDEQVPKDVADVLTFPGGTNVHAVTLSTDASMIEHQVKILEKNLYKEFGLTRTEAEDIGGLGTVSGYALEVLSRKDKGTMRRIRKNSIANILSLANAMLDMRAIRTAQADGRSWWDIDVDAAYPNRKDIKVTVGTGDIVDQVGDRDDFSAGIVSRRYVLRRKGLTDDEIAEIEAEVDDEKNAEAGRQMTIEDHKAQLQLQAQSAQLTAQGKQSGSTQGST